MSIRASQALSNFERSKNEDIMPSLISSNCGMSSKYIEEGMYEGMRQQQQHYCITLGVGPLWWSDAPHAALSVSTVNTESRGVGIKQSQLSVSSQIVQENELLNELKNQESLRITFALQLTESTCVKWETVVWKGCLYIQVPSCLLPEGSKEGFVSLLEYAEETLHCTNVVVCLRKDRTDRAMLVRTFMFLGFTVLPPTHALVPPGNDSGNLYMLYAIE
ncbi:LOW QUALITY PROTEIN: ornithine decarboxylase antizyme 1 [Neodiprion virginianus]|uniref:Ornithine decarboxylase antizyme n=1 Tax=Neodiprion lecontei TaxID=441921 RepID=A0A6J0C3C7_NEOLC|nr:LOW QUALITY PROTEIN: ornithine decarboxylase antizyme 1 [Neodiprion lecontei]XP_046414912.1 LOW QUALITY PROTEIN: ornithine decarboxylase antizyme 1 [Neodiprion fabricii]XP_046470732.1 LOW QUALITY PROTEIN: ornithine decarboxylase antizyme 1 [Neodiprion pinetum]XP_046608262.1 LOW QUALITY PROTEIN: ornithine decarboxylase antizyme 1 [Neodiprion virginianus]